MSIMNPPNSLEFFNIDSAAKNKLKSKIEVYLTKFSIAQIGNIHEFPKSGNTFKQWRNLRKKYQKLISCKKYRGYFYLILCKA